MNKKKFPYANHIYIYILRDIFKIKKSARVYEYIFYCYAFIVVFVLLVNIFKN